jgi:DNA-directed RNA polymerase subunit RPC12/RpoP
VIVAVVVSVFMFVSARREVQIAWVMKSQDAVATKLRRGGVELWWNNVYLRDDVIVQGVFQQRRTGFHIQWETPYEQAVTLAWRPFHAAGVKLGNRPAYHGLYIPMWPVAAVALLVAGYAHGLVVGARRETIGRCRRCGYDVRALPAGAACPECGEAAGVHGQPPVVVSIDARSDLKSLTKSGSW